MVVGVVFFRRHFCGHGVTDRIANPLTERTRRGLDSYGFVEFGVTGSFAVELPEVFDLFKRKVVTGKMEPAVEEDAAVTSRKDKTVPVEPFGLGGVIAEVAPEENRADLGGTEGQS